MAQTELAKVALEAALPGCQVSLVLIRSEADVRPEEPIDQFGDKGVFTSRVEQALLDGRADIAVHSLKDVPVRGTSDLLIGAFLKRDDPWDVLVSRDGQRLGELPLGATIGTGSLRRQVQLREVRRDLSFRQIRGNVDTRLRKLDQGQVDALVLAAAGLERLGLSANISEYLDPDTCVPAPGQGIVALQARRGSAFLDLLRSVNDVEAELAARLERRLGEAVGADCNSAFGALATTDREGVVLRAVLLAPDGALRRIRRFTAPDRVDALAESAREELLGVRP